MGAELKDEKKKNTKLTLDVVMKQLRNKGKTNAGSN